MSHRYVDESALQILIDICNRPSMYIRGTTNSAIAYMEGFLAEKCVYRLNERMHQALELPSNVDVWYVLRDRFESGNLENPLYFVKSLAEELLSEIDTCIGCGQAISDDDIAIIANKDCLNRVPRYGIRFVHPHCCVESSWPNCWRNCFRCGNEIPPEKLMDAYERLVLCLEKPGSIEYGEYRFVSATVDWEEYWRKLVSEELVAGTIVDRYRNVRDTHIQINSAINNDFPDVEPAIRQAFLPVHRRCN